MLLLATLCQSNCKGTELFWIEQEKMHFCWFLAFGTHAFFMVIGSELCVYCAFIVRLLCVNSAWIVHELCVNSA